MSTVRFDKYKKWRYGPGEKVVWAGLSGTVIQCNESMDTVKLVIHKQASTEGYVAIAMLNDVSLPYPTRTESGWVWPEVELKDY